MRVTPDNGHGNRCVFVLATSEDGTQMALRRARSMARANGASLVLLIPVVTPYGPVPSAVNPSNADVSHFRALAERIGPDVSVRACSCREAHHIFGRLLLESATVVVGGHCGRWRRTAEERLAQALMREGHHVTFVTLQTP
jgi:hypothetical protein